jgi:antitoxin (DNA-binding transcriptional repressor) of toxin-antitoxin stability system
MGIMSIREFNANVSAAIARVEAGEIIEITKNNRTVAELRPKRGPHDPEWVRASEEMMAIMRRGIDLGGQKFTEEDKYGDAEL